MWRFLTQGLIFTIFFLFGLMAIWFWYQHTQVVTLKVAAGLKSSDSYQLMQTITETLHERLPRLRFQLLETGGSKQNLQLLAEKRVHLVTAQSDVFHTDTNIAELKSVRLIAYLYPDFYQLLVRKEAAIGEFADLAGKQVAIAGRGSGQYDSFWLLADHYGLSAKHMQLLSLSNQAANQALLARQVDAVFRVRTLLDRNTKHLVQDEAIEIKAIEQARTLNIKNPFLKHAVIPKGVYQVKPSIPPKDLDTVSVQRLLLTHNEVPKLVIYEITRMLFEERYVLSKTRPLARFIQQPNTHPAEVEGEKTVLQLHKGSDQYYHRNEPSFLEEQAELIALMISLSAILFSYLLHLQKNQKKKRIKSYNKEILRIHNKLDQQLESLSRLEKDLFSILKKANEAQSRGDLNTEDFQIFFSNWKVIQAKLEFKLHQKALKQMNQES